MAKGDTVAIDPLSMYDRELKVDMVEGDTITIDPITLKGT